MDPLQSRSNSGLGLDVEEEGDGGEVKKMTPRMNYPQMSGSGSAGVEQVLRGESKCGRGADTSRQETAPPYPTY